MPRHLRSIPVRFLLVFLGIWSLASLALRAAPTTATDLGQFPAVAATSLDKHSFSLPADFAGQLNLVIVSFAREQQQQVDTWIQPAQQLETRYVRFRYYELPTMSRENLLYRWWFDSALRSNTTDPKLRRRILTVYVKKHKFRQSLKIANEKQIVALLVDRAGHVLWRADGGYTKEHELSLVQVLSASGL